MNLAVSPKLTPERSQIARTTAATNAAGAIPRRGIGEVSRMNRLSAIVRAMAPTRDLGGLHIGLTGGGGHLGSAMALGLAQAGARVVITGRHAEPLEEVAARALAAKYAGSVVVAVADVSNAADTERVLDVIAEPAARVDGWVNNAYNGAGGLLGKL